MRLLLGITVAWLVSSAFATTLVPRQNDDGDYKVVNGTLQTPWTLGVGTNPWPEYPRPRLQRSEWRNLNGVWRYRNGTEGDISNPPFGQHLEQAVLVPFCLESALSGMITFRTSICDLLTEITGISGKWHIYSWYQTSFEVPADWLIKDRVLLNFGAVDYEATVFVNGHNATFHRGGYFEFSVDVTPFLNASGANEL
jgi:hypothetical protein